MKYLITGGCGFVGSNLALEVFKQKEELFILDNLYREGSVQNLQWLQSQGSLSFFHSDIRSYNDVEKVIKEVKPDVIFHLAGQVAMTTSIADPRIDFETNALGSLNLLEAVRKHSPDSIVVYSSTNKVYGDFEFLEFEETDTRFISKKFPNGFDELTPLDFHSPYGCSKGTADQYMLDYARIFKIKTIVFRHSSMFGERQFATFDQGWIGWFIQKAIEIKAEKKLDPFTISGNGKQVRDILFASDLVNCYFAAAGKIEKTKGEVFNIGGGVENSMSLLELFNFIEGQLKISMVFKQLPWRESDQKVFIADNSKANKFFDWKPEISKEEGITKMIKWIEQNG